jgi:HIV Tat-specific factor 1
MAEVQTKRPDRKLLEWDDEDGFGPMTAPEDSVNTVNRNSRVVVLKHMFTLKELDEEASLLLDLKEDVREECSMLGDVTNVVLYDVRLDILILHVFLTARRESLTA